ncbi:MAG: DUF481 domain-containing protein [Chitinophagales bacterium]
MKKVIATAFVLFSSMNVILAQLQENDTAKWQVNTALSGKFNSGNVVRFIITPELNVTHIASSKKYGFTLNERYTFGTFRKIRSENDLFSRNFFYIIPTKKVYPYLMYWMQTHNGQGLKFRYQVGIGATYVPLRKNGQVIKLSITGTFEQNWYKQNGLTFISDTSASKYNAFRFTARIFGSHHVAKNMVELYYEAYFQQAVNNKHNFHFYAESGLNVRIIKGFSMKTFLTYEYQKVHIQKVQPSDLVFNFGVNYRFITKK